MNRTSRYHPLLVTLHWVLAILIVATLGVGFLWLAQTPTADPHTIGVLRWHMAGGMLILALMALRFVVRFRTLRPAKATTGHRLLDQLAPISHHGFYVMVLLVVGTGYTTAILAGLPAIVFTASGSPLPPAFTIYPSFVAHALLATILANLIVLHMLAVSYHQFIRKGKLLQRMYFVRRGSDTPTSADRR